MEDIENSSTVIMADQSAALAAAASPACPKELPVEIWHLIAEQIFATQDLKRLMLVSRTFQEIFGKVLYCKYSFAVTSTTIPATFAKNRHQEPLLRHVRDLEINFRHFEESDRGSTEEFDSKLGAAFNVFCAEAIKDISSLNTLRWKDTCSSTHTSLPIVAIIDGKMFNVLQKCGSVKHLHIVLYNDDTGPYRFNTGIIMSTYLRGFQYLTSIEIYQLDSLSISTSDNLSELLRDNPFLKVLGLSHCRSVKGNFIYDMSRKYSSFQGTKPLGLKTLKLGRGLYLPWQTTDENYLKVLVQLENIEVLHLDNTDRWEGFQASINWKIFEACKSVRQFAVKKLDQPAMEWLKERSSITELIVTYATQRCQRPSLHTNEVLPILNLLYTKQILDGRDLGWSILKNGAHLTRVSMDLDEPQVYAFPLSSFARRLAHFKSLTQLRIEYRGSVRNPAPLDAIKIEEEIAMQNIQMVRLQCPKLRYGQIQKMAWEITVPEGAVLPNLEDSIGSCLDVIHLRRLDERERMTIELFSMGQALQDSGLA